MWSGHEHENFSNFPVFKIYPIVARKIRVLIRLDADHSIGMAHAVRTAALLDLLATPCERVIAGRDEKLKDVFSGCTIIDPDHQSPDRLRRVIGETEPDMVVVDHPGHSPLLWREVRAATNSPVVAIDDEGGDIDADLIINGAILEEYHRYRGTPPGVRILTGVEFALIRPAFGKTPWTPSPGRSVMIVVGSGDRAARWALMIASDGVDMSGWGEVSMVVGAAFPVFDELDGQCGRTGIRLGRGLSSNELAAALSKASAALITGGMIVYETLAVGTPAVVFPQIENLIPEARRFAAERCIIDLGYEGGMDGEKIKTAVNGLLDDPLRASAMSLKQRSTVDGLGMERAARAIDDLLSRAAGRS